MATSDTSRQPAKLTELAPGLTAEFVREALHPAIHGMGPLPPAAGAQGFLTNLGGLATMAYMVPANITGLALVQSRMVAGIAHLRGYDLTDPRVRNAVLVSMLGEDAVRRLVGS